MNDYFKHFNVESSEFDLLRCWPYETGFLPNYLRPLSRKIPDVPPKPLTIRLFVESMKSGC
ncbi:DUF1493 family protein [Rosenbergiella collisarenosi]|uniref:DUF1493 family protein n=1 Tax=Rosenbergiella collisarenosi TaxID=1544695 RepID=UPI001BDA5A72|nr:DUF1493 family protein [Rosenbergiella collisarenosi]